MNSGFGDFQDLINTTTTGQEIDDIQNNLKEVEIQVDTNTSNIASNLVTINQNTQRGLTNRGLIDFNLGNITANSQILNIHNLEIINNTSGIASNDVDIAQNTTAISNNTTSITGNSTIINLHGLSIADNSSGISSNDTDILQLQTDQLKKDGSVSLDATYAPSNNQDIATKQYVDSSSSGSDPTKLDKSNGVVDNSLFINNGSNSLTLDGSNNLVYTASTGHLFKVGSSNIIQTTGTATVFFGSIGFLSTINGIYPNEFAYLSGLTGNIQTQINGEIARATSAENSLDTAKLNLSGGNMTGVLDLGNNDITGVLNLKVDNIICQYATNFIQVQILKPISGHDIFLQGTHGMGFHHIRSNFSTSPLDCQSDLNMDGNDITNVGTINGYTMAGLDSDISTNAGDIVTVDGKTSTNATAISTNISNIYTNFLARTANTTSINTNSGNITTNSTDISTNAANITTNTTLANTKLSKTGGTMTGNLEITTAGIIELGSDAVKNTSQSSGEIKYNVISNTVHRLDITGGLASYTQSTPLTQITGDLQASENILAYGDLRTFGETTLRSGLSIYGSSIDANGSNTSGSGNDLVYNQIYIRNPYSTTSSGTGAHGWILGGQVQTPTSSDNDFYFNVQRNGNITQPAYIADNTGLTKMNFTGQHRCQPMFTFTEDMVGLIVESTGRYMNFIKEGEECSQISCITINDSLPMVKLCNEEKSKKAFGVISAEEEKRRTYETGNFVSMYKKVAEDNRLFINGVGEGAIWVCSKNGNLENGDYITSAGINGYGMKQDSEFLANYTVAKITMDCDFDPQLEETKIWENDGWVMTGEYKPQYECIELDDGMRVAFVGCSYHCS